MDALIRSQFEARILEALDAARKPMVWGLDDCMLWVADILRDVLGIDPAHAWGRGYEEAEARSRLGRRGILPVVIGCAREFGWREISPKQAKPGDVAIVKVVYAGRHAFSAMICRAAKGEKVWFVGRNEQGATLLEASLMHRAWSVL